MGWAHSRRRAGWGWGGEDAARHRLLRRACSRSCARPLPALWGRREAQLSVPSCPREALGHVPRPDKDRLGARSAARNLAISAPRAAAPARPGDARSLSAGGKARQRRPRPWALGCPRGPGARLPPLPLAFQLGASSRGTPASRRPGAPSAQSGALASPLLARPRCLLKVTRRSGRVRGASALAAACAAAHPSALRAARGRPGCRLLPPQSPLLNQRWEASPPPPAARAPGAAIGRAGAPRPGLPPAPAAAPLAAGLRQPLHKPGRARVELYKASERWRGGRLEASPVPGLGAGRRRRRRLQRAPALRRPQAVGLREPEDGSERRPRREYPLRCPHSLRRRKFLPPCTPLPTRPQGWRGRRRGTGKTDTATEGGGGGGCASNLPRGAGPYRRAEPPPRAGGEAGAGLEVEERWERGVCGPQPARLAGKVLGARWRSAVWGGDTGAARGAEQVRRDVPGGIWESPSGAQPRAGEATGLG